MKNLKISHQLLLLVLLLIAGFAAATYMQLRTSTQAIYAERYGMLRTQVESGIGIFKRFQALEASGAMGREEAQKRAFEAVSAMTFTPDGYLFAYDYDVNMRVHPDPKRLGQSFKGKPDSQGFMYRDELVKIGRAGGGTVDFLGPKPGQEGDSFLKSSYALAFEPWQLVLVTGVYVDDLQAQIRSEVFKALSFGFVILLLGSLLAFVVIRNISGPLGAIRQALNAVADEDVTMQIPHTDMKNEVGLMARATQALQQKVRERHAMQESQQRQQEELDGERQHNLDMQRDEAALQARVVSTIGSALEQLAKGDLTVRCGDLGTRYAGLRDNFDEALGHLEAAMSKVNDKGIDIGGSKEEIRRASNELSQRTERQAANLEETSAALDELTVAVRQTADGARDAAQRVTAVSTEANRSDAVVEEAIGAMSGIEQSSAEITKIIGVIDEIAFQTNLLALNAGVEAARAGESGKGFAVVAQEVRELAQRSAAAAKEIKEQISRSSGQVANGVRLVGEAGQALKRISDQVKSASDIVGRIAHSAAEQDTTLRSISSSLNMLDQATQHNAAMAEETTASAEALSADTEELLNLIRSFRVSGTGRQPGALQGMGERMRRAG
ncbi:MULTISPECIES: methyl-accepting chemotaxis protein [Rhizobium/Agrobacterium group]|uniref:methyl-accepting chemotaxis protein n=1 Tax=Rhizobium/Agrobacterium group TaxID=227290 RepID=UPI001574C15E|nr:MULTISPECIES: methyl-accepting chemotaxis protein [Rhizobium/Agrobacterium group]MBD8664006.1 cache domain-containing protein [Rhizobium sp. CFBP 8752]NSY16408.1 HAMP domain-containing protein [Neorhizobium sp. AL 9.2.2]